MVDEIKLKAAIKKIDGWWASIFSSPVANYLLRYIADINWISPNHITLFALFLGVLASVCFVVASPLSMILGALLVQLSFIVDCMDGQLARYRQQFSVLGAWLDRIADRVKDFLYFFSLALGFFLKHRHALNLRDLSNISGSSTINYINYHFGDININFELWLVWPVAMLALFTILLIDYYVNQDMKLSSEEVSLPVNNSNSESRPALSPIMLVLSFGKQVYQRVPILRFNIGEQALLITIFTAFNAVFLMLIFFASLGTFYVFYWPVARLKGFTTRKVQ
ncbi:MAG: CDP-alcohol phosphatidyltransferase family protein [Cyanobacteria bacterium REEB446]|jgi:archaetidylinositol phosphate synthase|nr:CDP-alcohol phosphatidyltransferase family protein [Cyanobacteria bacterium REEB446]